jgi:hypothetical protein
MAGSNMYLPSMDRTSAAASDQKPGKIATNPTPSVNNKRPFSIPNLRPRWSAIGAYRGTNMAMRERPVSTRDSEEISTPSPRAKTARNGYTILCAVFRMVRNTMKTRSWKRIRKVLLSYSVLS